MDLHVLSDRWLYIVIALIVALIVLEMLRRIMSSPMGRVLRAVRDNPEAAAALGKNTTAVRLKVMMVGGSIAAIAGSLQVQFIGAYSTAGWTYTETFIFFAAVIVGGRGNLAGVALGGILVPGLFFEGTVLLPNLPQPELVGAVQWITTGALIVLFMWFRPQGVIPERRRRFSHRKTRRLGFRAFDNVVRRLVQGAG
jgi:ABC-type branched-subunit amino acid transport system permease subunit